MGSGTVVSPKPYRGKQGRKSPAGRGRATLFVDVQFDVLLDPDSDPILPKSCLCQGSLAAVNWDTPRSSVQIPEDAAGELEVLWQAHLARIRWRERNNLA
jgi:5-methylcytosine-specific restriction protein A